MSNYELISCKVTPRVRKLKHGWTLEVSTDIVITPSMFDRLWNAIEFDLNESMNTFY